MSCKKFFFLDYIAIRISSYASRTLYLSLSSCGNGIVRPLKVSRIYRTSNSYVYSVEEKGKEEEEESLVKFFNFGSLNLIIIFLNEWKYSL